MVGYLGKTTNWPEDVAGAQTAAERDSQWGEIPGEIISFNPETQKATIKPLYKPKFNGITVEMPVLEEVSLRFGMSGGGGLTHMPKPGDKVTLRPQMRSMDNYMTDGDGVAGDARSFHLSDMEAHIAGGESDKEPIKNFEKDGTHLRIDPEGKYGLRGSEKGGAELNTKKLVIKCAADETIHLDVEPGGAIYLGKGPPWFPVVTTAGPSQHVFAGISPAGTKEPDGWKG